MDTAITPDELDSRDLGMMSRREARELLDALKAFENVPSYVQQQANKFKSQILEQWIEEGNEECQQQ